MSADEKLQSSLALRYDVVVRSTGNTYVFYISELGLRHECANLEKGYNQILEMKDKWIRELAEEGLWHWLVAPGAVHHNNEESPRGKAASLKPFFIKLGSVLLSILVIGSFASRGLREIGYGMEKNLQRVAYWPPEKIEQHRAQAESIVKNLKPVVQEVLKIFEHDEANATSAGRTIAK